jgi:hypothetical protein
MRTWHLIVLGTIASSALGACSDAAVDHVTAPRIAATPAVPVTNQWPYVGDFAAAGIPSAIGIQITTYPRFENEWKTFAVDAHVRFQWANEAYATLNAWLVDSNVTTVNSGSASMYFKRIFLPVAYGDTTFTVKISTHNRTCGLMGKNSYTGGSAQQAINFNFLQITLWQQKIDLTTGADLLQPECAPPGECTGPESRVVGGITGVLASEQQNCNDAPSPPPGSGGGLEEALEICYTVWRQLWIWDFVQRWLYLAAEWPLGVHCYYVGLMI